MQGRCGQQRMAGEFGPEGGINSPSGPGEIERGYDDADSPRMSAVRRWARCVKERGYVVEH